MGVLDIRRSSVGLQNISGLPRAIVDNGAVDAARIRARNAEATARGVQVAVGGAVDLVRAMAEFSAFRDGQKIDEAVRQYQLGMNAYGKGVVQGGTSGCETFDRMVGLGPGGYAGSMTNQIVDSKKWLEGNVRFRDEFSAKLKDDLGLTDRQYEEAKKRLVGYDVTTQNGWFDRARQTDVAQEYGAASENWKAANEVVCDRNCASEAWAEWVDSADRMRAATDARRGYAMTDEEFAGMKRKAALGVLMSGMGQFVGSVSADASLMDDPDEAEAVWNMRISAVEKAGDESFVPPSSSLTDPKTGKTFNPLLEALGDADMKAFRDAAVKDMKAAKADWEKGMRDRVRRAFDEGQDVIAALPVPEEGDDEGMKAYCREVADRYARLIARDPNVTSGKGTGWIRPDILKWGGGKVDVALAAIKGAEYKADRARRRNNGRLFDQSITLGVPDDSSPGGYRPLSANEKIELSEFMYGNGEIDYPAYARGIKSAKDQADPLAAKFLATVTDGLDAKFPTVCQWQKDMMAYRFRDTKEARDLSGKGTGVSTKVAWDDLVQGKVVTKYDRTEEWLYGQLADAATLVVRSVIMDGRRNGEDDAALLNRAKVEYDKLTQGVNEGIYRLGIERRMAANRANQESMKAARSGRPTRWLPQGIELSRKNKAKFGGGQNKDGEGR